MQHQHPGITAAFPPRRSTALTWQLFSHSTGGGSGVSDTPLESMMGALQQQDQVQQEKQEQQEQQGMGDDSTMSDGAEAVRLAVAEMDDAQVESMTPDQPGGLRRGMHSRRRSCHSQRCIRPSQHPHTVSVPVPE